MHIHLIAVITCALAAFIVSSVWYTAFGTLRAALLNVEFEKEKRPEPSMIALELLRTFVLALAFAIILSRYRTVNVGQSLYLGLLLWVAFPFVLLGGSVMWDKVPLKLAAIHGGDWLLKLLLIAGIIGAWR